MPLEPKNEYTAKIYAELLCSTGAKLIELAGKKKAEEIFLEITKPIGERDCKKIAPLLGTKKDNAAHAALLTCAASDILDIKISVVKLDPHSSQLRIDKCPYGEAVRRQKDPPMCKLCYGYCSGLVAPLGVSYVRGDMAISSEHNSCFMTYLCMNPSGDTPQTTRADTMTKILRLLVNKNELIIAILAPMLAGIGEYATNSLGDEKAALAAKKAYEAGIHLSSVFPGALGLTGEKTDAAKLVEEARKVLDCRVNTYHTTEGFTIYTKSCPHRTKCTAGSFLEVACTEYTRGLLSKYGSYEIKTSHDGETCKQDFMQASPKTEGGKNAA